MSAKRNRIPKYGTVEINGHTYYRTIVTDSDGNRISLYAKTRAELYDKEMDTWEQIENDRFYINSPTVSDYCENWLKTQAVHIRATTLADYTSKVKRYIINPLGNHRIAEITLDDIQMALIPISKLSASVYKCVVVLYKAIFRSATENHIIAEDPTIHLSAKGGIPQTEKTALTDEQARQLLDAVRDLPPYVFVMLGLYAGLRREEILALQWDSVYLDAEAPYLTVRRAWHTEHNRPIILNELKTNAAARSIPLPDCLAECLREAKANSTSEYVIANSNGEPLSYTQFKRLWQYVTSVMVPGEAMAGEEFTLTLTLKNSLTTKSVKNMLVKVDTGNLHINLLEDTNIFQIDKIAAGGETTLTLRFGTDASIPAGKYTLNFVFNYDSSKTLNLSSSGTAIVEIQQPANMELVMPRFPQSVTVGETIPLSLQVMNMGRDRMYNVRCVVSGYGFAPANTGYIGAMDAGSSATTEVELYIIALNASKGNENGEQYGATVGTITLIYEDESGEEFSQEVQFETSVNRPIVEIPQTDTAAEEEEKATNQWWISVVILGGVICAAGIGFFLIKQYRKNRSGKYL